MLKATERVKNRDKGFQRPFKARHGLPIVYAVSKRDALQAKYTQYFAICQFLTYMNKYKYNIDILSETLCAKCVDFCIVRLGVRGVESAME